jgi:hypothetical protein
MTIFTEICYVIKYNYSEDLVFIDGVDYNLEPYRRWLLKNYDQLCSSSFVKAISIKDKIIFTYDWQTIYLKAEEYFFLNQYIDQLHHEINSTGISQVPRDVSGSDQDEQQPIF